MDVTLSIDKNTKRLSKSDSGGDKKKGKASKKKVSTEEIRYTCELKSYTKKDISGITADYTIYKRVSTRGEGGSKTTTEEIAGSAAISALGGHGGATFETDAVVCEDSSQKGGKGPSTSKRETVIGFVVKLSANGEEFLQKSHPENFIDRLEEERKREEAREKD